MRAMHLLSGALRKEDVHQRLVRVQGRRLREALLLLRHDSYCSDMASAGAANVDCASGQPSEEGPTVQSCDVKSPCRVAHARQQGNVCTSASWSVTEAHLVKAGVAAVLDAVLDGVQAQLRVCQVTRLQVG